MKQKSCVVIGAGLAGLAAAYRLKLKNWRVTVVEAQKRLGGRVLSHRFKKAPVLVCELGGEWIGDDHNGMKRLCCAFGLNLLEHRYAYSFWDGKKRPKFYKPGKWPLSAAANAGFEKIRREYQRHLNDDDHLRQMDKLDWWTKLQLSGFSENDLLRRDLMDGTDFGESIRHTSAYIGAGEYFGSRGAKVDDRDEMDYKIEGGNDRLIRALENAIGSDNIRKKFEVNRIRQGSGSVQVFAKGRRREKADYCICTVPAHYLRHIKWQGGVPNKHLEAALQLQYARITKTAVLCPKRFWPNPPEGAFSIFTTRASDFCFHSTHLQEGTKRILCSYAVGDKADDIASTPVRELGKWIVTDVARAFGRSKRKAKALALALAVKRQAWQSVQDDPFTGGAYAFYRSGQWFTVMPTLRRPFKRVYFAGEHLSDNWQGFMEGAVETGQAAADRIARKARKSKRKSRRK